MNDGDVLVGEKRLVQVRPWNDGVHKPEIPWQQRTFGLSLSSGKIVPLEEEWIPEETEGGRKTGRMIRKPDTEVDQRGCWIGGQRVKYPMLNYKQTCELFDDCEESGDPITVAFVRLHGRSTLTLDQISHVGSLPKFYVEKEKREEARKAAKKRANDDEIFAAAGIDVPDGVGSAGASDKAFLAKTASGGVSMSMPKGVKTRGRAVPGSLGSEGNIGTLKITGAQGEG